MRRQLAIVAVLAGVAAAAPAHAVVPDSYLGPTATFPFPEPGPTDVAVAPDGSFYVTIGNDVQRHDANGALVETWPGAGAEIVAIAVDQLGYVYVADREANAVRKYAPGGALLETWTGFEHPGDVAAGPAGVLVAEREFQYPSRLQLRSADGDLLASREDLAITQPGGVVAQGPDGGLWLRTDLLVERLDPASLSTVASFSHDAPDHEQELRGPRQFRCCGIAASERFVWVGDAALGRIERYSTAGVFSGACEDTPSPANLAAGPGDSVFQIQLGSIVRYATVSRPAQGCDRSPPQLGAVTVSVRTAKSRRARRAHRGYAIVSLYLEEPLEVTMRFMRLRRGLAPKPRGGRTFAAERGLTKLRVPRAPGTLRRGVYRMTLSAADEWGNRGSSRVRFRVR